MNQQNPQNPHAGDSFDDWMDQEALHPARWYDHAWWLVRRGAWEWLRERPSVIVAYFVRGKRGWADRDVWNMDMYVARVIGEMLVQLRRSQRGYPAPYEERGGAEAWDRDIDEQIAVWKGYVRLMDGKTHDNPFDPHAVRWYTRRMKKLLDVWPALWD